MPRPVECPDLAPVAEPRAAGPVRLVTFGQIARHKGVLEALEALAQFRGKPGGAGATLDLIGGGVPVFGGVGGCGMEGSGEAAGDGMCHVLQCGSAS